MYSLEFQSRVATKCFSYFMILVDMWVRTQHYKEIVVELTETCPNQDVINDRKLIEIVQSDRKLTENVRIDSDLSKMTKICQFFVNFFVIYHVLIRTCFVNLDIVSL